MKLLNNNICLTIVLCKSKNKYMKRLFTILCFALLSSFTFGQTDINYTVTTSGDCFPMTVTINVSTNNPDVSFYAINSSFPSGSWQFLNINDPYSFIVSTPSVSIGIGVYAFSTLQADLYETIVIPGNAYSLSSTVQEPYVVGVGDPFPIQLNSNDPNITSIQWNFGNGQLQNGGSSVNPTYATTGNYMVTCTIESVTCGTIVRTMEVFASAIEASFPSAMCVGSPFIVTFTGMHPSTVSYYYIYSSGSQDLSTNQVELEFSNPGIKEIMVYCYDINGSVVDMMMFEFTVNGESYYVTPSFSFIKLGETIDFSLHTDSGNPLNVSNIIWSTGGNTPSISEVINNSGYQTISVEFVNTCNNQMETQLANVYAVDGSVIVNTVACAPDDFTVSYVGDELLGLGGLYLYGNQVDEWFDATNTFTYNFTEAGEYFVEVAFNGGDSWQYLTYPIYISGPTVNSETVTTCGSYQFGSDLLTQSGNYQNIFQTNIGCDSTVNLTLTIIPDVTTSITLSAGTLTATGGDSYQWFNCATGAIIPGATNATFTPQETGLYGVIAYLGDCSDSTEVCFEVSSVGLNEVSINRIQIYPNPTSGQFTIANANGSALMIYDVSGKLVYNQLLNDEVSTINLSNFDAGVYVISLLQSNGSIEQNRLVVIE
jgi:hypothetical protein